MTTSEWVHLIKTEFNCSSSVAKNMYHLMVEYYKLNKELNNGKNNWWLKMIECENKNCNECMKDASYSYCCKLECGEHEFCRKCILYNK